MKRPAEPGRIKCDSLGARISNIRIRSPRCAFECASSAAERSQRSPRRLQARPPLRQPPHPRLPPLPCGLPVQVQELDVSSLASVRAFAKAWTTSDRLLDVLICNAGMDDFGEAPRAETADGFEVHLETNYLGHALLTRLLVPNLLAAGEASGHTPRVVMVTSLLHFLGRIDKNDVNLLKGYDHRRAYTQSKLFQVLFAAELARRSNGKIFAVSVHPGLVATDIARGANAEQRKKLASFERMAIPAKEGCRSSLVAAASEDLLERATQRARKGEPVYLHWTGSKRKASPAARDRTLQSWAWNWTAEAVGVPKELQKLAA